MFLEPTLEAVLITTALTFLTTVIEIQYSSKSRFSSCVNSKYFFYFLIQLLGNIVSTILAFYILSKQISEEYQWWNPLFSPFIGIFAFEFVLSNTNINFFDKKILTFQDWVYKAKDPVTARSVQKDLEYTEKTEIELIDALAKCTNLQEINTFLYSNMTNDEIDQLEADIKIYNKKASKIDEHLYKCKELVSRFPNKAKALINNRKK